MADQRSTATSLLRAIAGTLGFSVLAGFLVTILVAPAIAVTGVTATNTVGIFNELPEYIQLDSASQQNTIAVRNADGTLTTVATIYRQNRQEVGLDLIDDDLECAALAGEDRRFYEHAGVDLPSLVRAAIGQITDTSDSGASTLTMQLVRNILQHEALNNDEWTQDEKNEEIAAALAPTLDRKIKEMKLAIGLEKNYTKDEILQAYLNIAGFGGNTYGVQAAAKEFFGKSAADLTIAEAASLIAIVQEPNSRSLNDPENYADNQARRDVILKEMKGYGCITAEERDEALAIPVDEEFVNIQPSTVGCLNASQGYGYICDYALHVVDELGALGGTPEERQDTWDRGGFTLVLTIDPGLQAVAWNTVHQWAPSNETRFDLGAVATSVGVGTGNILTMAQNKTFDDSLHPADPLTTNAVNLAADLAHGGSLGFQPGSTYKPYVLLAFLAAGHGLNESYNASIREVNQAEFADSCGPALLANGEPRTDESGNVVAPPWGGKYKFRNDSNEQGSYKIERGTAQSVNSVFIQMAKAVDQCDIKKIAESIGVHDAGGHDLVTRPSCSIGGCENNIAPLTQAAAYAAIANGGVYCEPIMIAAVIDRAGETHEGQAKDCSQSLVSPSVANTAAHAMAAVMSGTGSASNPNDKTPYIGKTGTTDESVHTWMVGSSTQVATAVWVGNITGKQAMRNVRVNGQSGGLLRHRIFKTIAQAIDVVYPGGAFPGPDPALLTGTTVDVPDVIGHTLEQAKRAIEIAELNFEHGGDIDSDLPAGQVAATDPAPGTAVSRGATVRVYTSNGLAVPVPDVIGMSRGDAESALDAAGFGVNAVCVDDSDLGSPLPPPTVDDVTSQDPPGGTMRNPASTTVRISYYRPICP
ncbi:transglycosylase domain-containing protein [Pseudolysinimonas yzui]|uniref:Carboxypeptidase n=1 Tax=Pseudolysinimonas yzui TaxID=2708254 RepID=A0A8J3LZU4_9MICO|nr:transglycosylase domain-containing protein [Pseudolysinimonas yzui]GHF14453.1 carboxypeptidase [Pseudolysinimonas yzui]